MLLATLLTLAAPVRAEAFTLADNAYFNLTYTPTDADASLGLSFLALPVDLGLALTVSDTDEAEDFQIALTGLPTTTALTGEIGWSADFTGEEGPSSSLALSLQPSLALHAFSYYDAADADDEVSTLKPLWAVDLRLLYRRATPGVGGWALPVSLALLQAWEAPDAELYVLDDGDDQTVDVVESRVVGAPEQTTALTPSLGLLVYSAEADMPLGLGIGGSALLPLEDLGGSHSESAELWAYFFPQRDGEPNTRLGVGLQGAFDAGAKVGLNGLAVAIQARAGQVWTAF